jgi:hypothetical protein
MSQADRQVHTLVPDVNALYVPATQSVQTIARVACTTVLNFPRNTSWQDVGSVGLTRRMRLKSPTSRFPDKSTPRHGFLNVALVPTPSENGDDAPVKLPATVITSPVATVTLRILFTNR